MKRILLLDHPQFTSATYFLWQGLRELEELYPELLSVSCYPYIPTNYDDDQCELRSLPWFGWLSDLVERSRRDLSLLPHGVPPFHPGESLTSMGETLVRRGSPWKKFQKSGIIDDEASAISEFEKRGFDLVVLGNSHRVPTILLGRLRERVKNFPPIVYLDAGERDELNEHWIHVFRPDLVFKQILTPEVFRKGLSCGIPGYMLKMYPLPLSSPLVDHVDDVRFGGVPLRLLREASAKEVKMLPIYYSLGSTWGPRAEIGKALDAVVLRNDLSRVKKATYGDYHLCLSKSRMAVTMRGSGRDTTRYWEIPLYRTAMLADGTMGCIHPYPFEHGKTAVFWSSVDDLVRLVEAYLPESGSAAEELSRIATAGQLHLERYHSVAARAVFFLDVLEAEIGFQGRSLSQATRQWKDRKGWDAGMWQGPVV